MPYVNRRWLGGMLTNYRTVKQSIKRMKDLDALIEEGGLDRVGKKEGLSRRRELAKLERRTGRHQEHGRHPRRAVHHRRRSREDRGGRGGDAGHSGGRGRRYEQPPEGVDYVIPGNDDAIRSIELYVSGAATAILEGREAAQREVAAAVGAGDEGEQPAGAGRTARKKKVAGKKTKVVTKKKVSSRRPAAEPAGKPAAEPVVEPAVESSAEPAGEPAAPDDGAGEAAGGDAGAAGDGGAAQG